jgi:polar amino acid transport system substrate-binding protein
MKQFRLPAATLALLASMASAHAQQSADPRIADIVRTGKLRVGLFIPQYTKHPTTGELKGPWIEVFKELGAHIGVPIIWVEHPTPPKMIECLDRGACDIGTLGFDPTRAAQVGGFTPPFMRMEYTLLVPAGSALQSIADADRPGVRIAAVRGHASTLTLGRILKKAEQVTVDVPDQGFDLLRTGKVEAWASIRPMLLDYARQLPGARVLDESYGANQPAIVVPKGQTARLAYVTEFVERAKATGIIQRALDRAGEPGYRVAPPDPPRH